MSGPRPGGSTMSFSSRMGRLLVLLALVAGAATPAHGGPSAAIPARGPEPSLELLRANLPPRAVSVRADDGLEVTAPSLRPADAFGRAFASRADARDPAAYVEAARLLLEDATGVKVVDPLARLRGARTTSSSPVPAAVEQSGATSTYRVGLPVGDLTGDGLEDALSFEVTYVEVDYWYEIVSVTLRALGGRDGAVLWSRDLADPYGVFPLPVGDLTGDGAADVLLEQFFVDSEAAEGTCALVACAIAADFEYRWVITLISGASGADVWTRTFTGRATDVFGFGFGLVAFAGVFAVQATNAAVVPILSGDHDGDGLGDVVFDSFDITYVLGFQDAYALLAFAFVWEPVVLVATHAEVIRGRDAATLFTRDAETQPGGAILLPAGDAVGGATGDLLWQSLTDVTAAGACAFAFVGEFVYTCVLLEHGSLALEMLDGATYQTAWTAEIEDLDLAWASAAPALRDLNGDARADLLLVEALKGPAPPYRIGVLSGADGAVSWRRPSDTYPTPLPLGPVGGGPGDDLLLVGFDYAYDGEAETLRVALERADGAAGTTLLTSERTFAAPWFVDLFLLVAGDADGDGVLDLVLDAFLYGSEDSSASIVESGRTASALFERSVPGVAFALPAGDVDAGGGDDVFHVAVEFLRSAGRVSLEAILLPGATALWSRVDLFQSGFGFLLLPTGAQDVGPGGDAVYTRSQYEGDTLLSRIDGLDGGTGALTWGHGDGLTPPPSPGTGIISGIVLGASGAPLRDVCVSAFSPAGDFVADAATGAAGGYRLTGLGTADYRVFFDECFGGPLAAEWYDDKPDFASADAVPVVDGAETAGIDAVLAPPSPGALLRTETKPYVGVGGDLIAASFGCAGSDPSVGGVCFDLTGEEAFASFTIADDTGLPIAGTWSFSVATDPVDEPLAYGSFCGASEVVPVTPGANRAWVLTKTLDGLYWCEEAGIPTTGTVTASFSGPRP